MENNNSEKKISQAVINRLPRYYRYLTEFLAEDKTRISSKELSDAMNVTASQIRQDLNCFGGFGLQGYGYNVEHLLKEISNILGVTKHYTAVIAGAGNLGKAITNSNIFVKRGITLKAIFDNNPKVIGGKAGNLTIQSSDTMAAFCKAEKIDIAVLTLPKAETGKVADELAEAGVKGFWNFSNMELKIKSQNFTPIVQNMHMGDSLMTLCYYLADDEG